MKYENATLLTKKALAESLASLILEEPYNKITINQIVDKCGLNRKTFYYHFTDKDALLVWTMEHELQPKLNNFNFITDFRDVVTCIIDTVEENEAFVSTIISFINPNDIKNIFLNTFMQTLDKLIARIEDKYNFCFDQNYSVFVKRFFAESIMDMIYFTISEHEILSRDKTIEYYSATFTSAMEGIIKNALNGTDLAHRKPAQGA